MHVTALRRLPAAIAIAIVIAAIATWILSAAPAGASASFDPQLSAEATATAPAAADTAPYTVEPTPKRETIVPAAKSAKRLTRAPGTATTITAARTASTSSSELTRARSILAGYIKTYPILKGTTVSIGDARGYQAIAFYQSARIVISPSHRASLDTIIAHEIWHVIDWRDNGRIDWGESVPPRNASSYR